MDVMQALVGSDITVGERNVCNQTIFRNMNKMNI